MNDLTHRLIQCISTDKKNPSKRQYVAQMMGLSDRECRRIKREAFLSGIPIVTSSSTAGCYISYDKDDILKVKRETLSRIREDLKTVKACDKMLESINQQELKGI